MSSKVSGTHPRSRRAEATKARGRAMAAGGFDLLRLINEVRAAERAIARLDAASELMASVPGYLYAAVVKDAVASCQLDGHDVDLVELFTFEAEAAHIETPAHVAPVFHALEALAYARGEIQRGASLSGPLVQEMHRRLVGDEANAPSADDVDAPPRADESDAANDGASVTLDDANARAVNANADVDLANLDVFQRTLQAHEALPPLVRVGLAHAEFEAKTPFSRESGRIARLLVPLSLEAARLIAQPLSMFSITLKHHRDGYERLVAELRRDESREAWLRFFLQAMAEMADDAVASARDLFLLVARDRAKLVGNDSTALGTLRLFEILREHPVVTVGSVMRWLSTTKPTAIRAIGALVTAGVLREQTGRKRGRTYAYEAYLKELARGTERLPTARLPTGRVSERSSRA